MKSKIISFVLLFAMLITVFPVNTFADTSAISVYAKSDMVKVNISGDTVNFDITNSVKDLAKKFSKAGKNVKVTLSYFDGDSKEINKSYSNATKFSVKFDTSYKMHYTIEFKPSYYANKETHYGYEYVILDVNGTEGSPVVPDISTGSTSSTNSNTNTSGKMDLGDGFAALTGTPESVFVDSNKTYTLNVKVPSSARDIYFVAYASSPTNLQI